MEQYYANLVECDESDRNFDDQTRYRYFSRHPRTAIGISDNTKIFLVVVDGRGYNNSVGVYLEELGLIMKYLGIDEAINVDGGGSSTAVAYNFINNDVDVLNVPSVASGTPHQGKQLRSVFSSVFIISND